MANKYVRSTDGSDADNGSTWALAKATLQGANGVVAAGDTIWLSQSHAESLNANQSTTVGTLASPVRIIGGNDAAEPPTAFGSKPTLTNAQSWSFANAGGYFENFQVIAGGATSNTIDICATGSAKQYWKNVDFIFTTNGGSAKLNIGSTASGNFAFCELENCRLKFGAGSQGLDFNCKARFYGGSIISGGVSQVNFIANYTANRSIDVDFIGFDFTNLATTANLALGSAVAGGGGGRVRFINCKLPASWSGSLVSTNVTSPGLRFELINTDNADTNYRLWIEESAGSIKHETTLIRTGGASDGTQGISWKLVTTSNVSYPNNGLETPPIMFWNDTAGSSKTATIEILRDSVSNLTDAQVWIRLFYMGTSGNPIATFLEDKTADIFTSATAQTASSATWVTTGMSNPNKQKLQVTFTPVKKGPIFASVVLAAASATVYVDPIVTLS